eukprot:TRINITY_DN6320_c0_g1_i1.p1 TRINITY_DN6320_c0_g1~~TRINITY_DN6320_c0_g1_i1.p1  ORF type:complete len:572 (-),score=71.91 TRINITY_DN6320_c0_g1_i1:77-1792(-)
MIKEEDLEDWDFVLVENSQSYVPLLNSTCRVRTPFVDLKNHSTPNWKILRKNEFFIAQQYLLGDFGKIFHFHKDDPHVFRIITTHFQEIIVARKLKDIILAFDILENEIVPRLLSLNTSDIWSILQLLLTALFTTGDPKKLDLIIESWKNDENEKKYLHVYNYTYVESLSDIASKYPHIICPHCEKPAIDPVSVKSTTQSYVFCRQCAYNELNIINELKEYLPPPSKEIVQLIDSLLVYCPFICYGCTYEGPRGIIEEHIDCCSSKIYTCIYRYKGCIYNSKTTSELNTHIESCEFSSSNSNGLTLETLPTDIIVFGLRYLSVFEFRKVALLSKYFHELCEKPTVWKYLSEREGLVECKKDKEEEGDEDEEVNSFLHEDKSKHILCPSDANDESWKQFFISRFRDKHSRCVRCGSMHLDPDVPVYYHPGLWNKYTYRELLDKKNSKEVHNKQVEDKALLALKVPATVLRLTGKSMATGALYGGAFFLLLLSAGEIALVAGAVGILAGGIGGLLYGLGKSVSYSYKLAKESSQAKEENREPEIGFYSWSCCDREGSFAKPCVLCPERVVFDD